MATITPHLWFDKEAREAAELYVSIFPESRVTNVTTLHNTPSGDSDIVSLELSGQPFMAISAGPFFRFNPSVSFMVMCDSRDEVDRIWHSLLPGGMILMELGEYPFSARYGWLQDKFGLSWQIYCTNGEPASQKIIPVMMFVGEVCGRAEEALNYWTSVFHPAKIETLLRYGKGDEPDKEGSIKHARFSLLGAAFGAMDSAYEHKFAFNEAISFIISCESQEEIDYFWNRLSSVPEAEQCGWLKDKFGVSWQVAPKVMGELMQNGTPEQVSRVTQAFLPMKKLDIAKIRAAFDGK